MRYKNILWDWNGTILDDTPVAFEATNILLEKYGYPVITLEYYRDNMDTPVENFYRKIFDLSRHGMQMLDEEWGVLYHQLSYKITLHEGVENLLRHFKQENCHQVVLSAFRTEEITNYARRFSIESFFECILGTQNIVMESKTMRGRAYMQENRYLPEQTLYIGDTVHDYETALALGVDCVLFSGGQQSPRVLRQCGVPVCDRFESLEKNLLMGCVS